MQAVYVSDAIMRLCESLCERFFRSFDLSGAEYVLHLERKLICLYGTAACQTVTGIQSLFSQLVQLTVRLTFLEIYQQFVLTRCLPRGASTAPDSLEGGEDCSRSASTGKLYRKCDSQLQRVGQWESRTVETKRGRKRVRPRDTLLYSCA